MPKKREPKPGPGFYRRRGSRFWWHETDPVTKKPASTRQQTAEGARAWLAEREKIAIDPNYAATHEATLGEWTRRMLESKVGLRSEATQRFYRQKSGHLLRVFGGERRLETINAGAVRDYLQQRRREGAHHYTISKEFTALRQILKLAEQHEMYRRNISAVFPDGFGHGYTPREVVMPVEDEARLAEALTEHQWACVCFILATSARVGELLRARPEDYDKRRNQCRLRGTKTKSSERVVPIISIFRGYMETAAKHMPFDWAYISSDLAVLSARAGCTKISPNDVRRTCATRLIEHGVDPYLVAKITGHTSLKMLRDVYDRARPDKVAAAIEAQIRVNAQESEKGQF